MDEDGAKAFNLFMEKNSTLHTFILNNCGLGVKSTKMMLSSQLINPHMRIQRLFLDNNNIHDLGLKYLGEYLAKQNCIVELTVRNNVKKTNDLGVSYLCESL